MSDIVLSRNVDQFVPKERWIASLSNGETIHEDLRPDEEPAWKRLGDYCREEGLSVTNLRAVIAGTIVKLPADMDGYIQKKQAWGLSSGVSGKRLGIGYVTQGHALIHLMDSMGDSLTIRPGHKYYKGDPGEPWTIYRKDIRDGL